MTAASAKIKTAARVSPIGSDTVCATGLVEATPHKLLSNC
jgi:hypothetical protein